MSSNSSSFTKYFFDENNSDISRLKEQYSFMKTMFGYPQLVPPEIDIAHISKVIDLATGTGAWVLDFASLPDVRDRNIQVFACDISTVKFPQAEDSEQGANKINFFQHDITEPFPDELVGTFDLVNVAFLCFALTEQGWKRALQNIYQLLRPGGHVILRDGDMVVYDYEHPPPPEDQPLNLSAYMQGTSVLANANRIFAGGALRRGFLIRLSHDLPQMLEEASLQVLTFQRPLVPFGNYCDVEKSLNGTPLSNYKAYTIANLVQLLNMVSLSMVKDGGLELADGIWITSEEGRQALMEEITRFVIQGGSTVISDWVAMRPVES